MTPSMKFGLFCFLSLAFPYIFLKSLLKLQMVLKQDETYVMTWLILPCVQEHVVVSCFYFVSSFIYHSSLTIV